jgi:hypothetical protein
VLRLSENATTLTLGYPAWLGILGAAVGYTMVYWLLRQAKTSKKPFQHVIAGIGGFIIVSLVCLSALLDATVLDAVGARESRLLAGARSVPWSEVVDVSVEDRRSGRKGMRPHLVLHRPGTYEIAMEIDGLDAAETARVLDFARARLGK